MTDSNIRGVLFLKNLRNFENFPGQNIGNDEETIHEVPKVISFNSASRVELEFVKIGKKNIPNKIELVKIEKFGKN